MFYFFRDVAAAHLKAAFLPDAVGHRHIIGIENFFSIILKDKK